MRSSELEVRKQEDKMRITPFVVGTVSTNCYLVWDEQSKEAMLVDPGLYKPVIDKAIEDNGLTLKYILLTHGHFDHVLGIESFLKSNPNAELLVNEADVNMIENVSPHKQLKEGDTVELGELSFRVIETPGHTEGGLSFYTSENDESLTGQSFSGTVFTGDTLFSNSIGRTDLPGGDFATLIKSIEEKLFILPDDTLVLPGHMDGSTIGNEKRFNPFIK